MGPTAPRFSFQSEFLSTISKRLMPNSCISATKLQHDGSAAIPPMARYDCGHVRLCRTFQWGAYPRHRFGPWRTCQGKDLVEAKLKKGAVEVVLHAGSILVLYTCGRTVNANTIEHL
jgi:hypothetical protein